MNVEKLLHDYAQEIGIDSLTIEELIESHRHLRSLNLENMKLQRELIDKVVERAYNEARDSKWVRWDDLRKMTLDNIIKILGPDD